MRIVVALGGNALLRRGQPMTAEIQRAERARRGPAARPDRRGQRARHLARQRPAGRAARPPGGGVRGGRGVSARRPRRPDRGDDRLHHRAGAGQPPAVRAAVREHPDDDRGRPGRPGLPGPRPSSSARSTSARRPSALAADEGLGDQARRRQMAARGRVPAAEADLRDPADPLAARERRRRRSARAAAASRRCTSRGRRRSSAPRS